MFSDDTQQYVASVADRLQEQSDPAAALYEHAADIAYGFPGTLEQDTWFRLPDELNGQANCHELGVYMYSVADAMDLDPRLFLVDRNEMDHVVIDVNRDGDRVVLDPLWSMYGPVDYFDDDHIQVAENPLDTRTRRSHSAIREQQPAEITESVAQLRESPERMLASRQKLEEYTTSDGDIREWLQYRDDQTIEHLIDRDTADGFYDLLVRITYDIDDDTITDETVTCADISGIGYSSITDETVIATLAEQPVDAADLDAATRHHIGRVTAYMQEADGRLYDAATLDAFWDDYRSWLEDHVDGGTGFDARTRHNTLNRLDRLADADRNRFLDRLDWLKFVDDRDIETPAQEQAEQLLETYLDRHRETLAYSKQQGVFDPVKDAVTAIASGTHKNGLTREAAADVIREQGIATTYDACAAAVEGATDANDIQQYLPLLAVHPELRDTVIPRLSPEQHSPETAGWKAIERLESAQSVPLTEDIYSGTATWTFDPNTYELTHRLTIDDQVATHDGAITVTYGFTPTGALETTQVTVADTMPHTDEQIVFYAAETEPGDVVFSDIQAQAVDRLDDIQASPVVTAPEPSRDTPFLDKNRVATGLYSRFFIDEVPERLLSMDERDAFQEQVRDEYERSVANAIVAYAEGQFLQEQLDEQRERAEIEGELAAMSLDELEQMAAEDGELTAEEQRYLDQGLAFARETGDPSDMVQFLTEYNYIISCMQRGDPEDIRSRVTDRFTESEQMQHYVNKFCDAFNDWFWTDTYDEQAATMIDAVSTGISMSIPDGEIVNEYTDVQSSAAAITVNEINRLVDAQTAWERKGPRIAEQLQELPDQYDTIGDTGEKDALYDALRSVDKRLDSRRRYHDWTEDGQDLQRQVQEAHQQLDTITVPETLSIPERQREQILAQLD